MFRKILLPVLLFCFFAISSFAQVNLTSGLVAYYPFNGNFNDASGNGNNGVAMNGTAFGPDHLGNPNSAASFDGINDWINVTNPTFLFGREFSIAFRFKTNAAQHQVMMANAFPGTFNGVNFQIGFQHPTYPGGIYLGTNHSGTCINNPAGNFGHYAVVPAAVTVAQWQCVVMTFNNGVKSIFLNGSLAYQQMVTGVSNPTTTDSCTGLSFRLGTWWPGDPRFFNGLMDEVRLYNRALNSLEIDTLCNVISPPTPVIVNAYAAVLSRNGCDNSFQVDDSNGFNVGDTVLMIQMKGAVIDSTNTASFGNVLDYRGAGNYEYNVVKARIGNTISLKYKVVRQYEIPGGKVQFVRVPYFQDYTVSSNHSCLAWNGSKGGVFALHVANTLTLNADVDVSGKGFRGGLANTNFRPANICNVTDYRMDTLVDLGSARGEGIADISLGKSFGRGHSANAGGGGNSHNSGGGGGSNGSAAGNGGNQWLSCGGTASHGIGGLGLSYGTVANKLFMGGGGGAGHANENGNKDGGNGGGMIIINAGTLNIAGDSLIANGSNAPECTSATAGCNNDGTGGGGGGGLIALKIGNYTGPVQALSNGGKGANVMLTTVGIGSTGPGGGGAGGVVWQFGATSNPSLVVTTLGGLPGVLPLISNSPNGATAGSSGQSLTGLQYNFPLPTDTFTSNIILPAFTDSVIACDTRKFLNATTTTSSAITAWYWNFGDGMTATLSNPTHTYATNGTYTVRLTVTDGNGCKDSLAKAIVVNCRDTIINKYAAIVNRLPCDNSFTVDDATGFGVGDTVLMIQMKGAVVDTSNTAAFGDIIDNKGAGNYEYNVIKSTIGNIITLRYKLARQYNIPAGRVQFVRVPNYQNYTITQRHTALPWNGTKGGVLIMNVRNTLTLNADIRVSGQGFLGGQINNGNTFACNYLNYFYPANSNDGGLKGEGIAEISSLKMRGKGKLANGGGGGNNTNSGGAGGANGGLSGSGGRQWANCDTSAATGGVSAIPHTYNAATNRLYLGGGGGAGHENNGDTDPAGNGGGIIIINAANLDGNGFRIAANGASVININAMSVNGGDGQSGGGAGGTVLLKVNSFVSNPFVETKGGDGGNVYAAVSHGPGGGGSGGAVLFGSATMPAANLSLTGGANGVLVNLGSRAYGATQGMGGVIAGSIPYVFPAIVDTFQPNNILPNFTNLRLSCFTYKFNNTATSSSTGLASWRWNAGVAGTSALKSPTFTFPDYGTYPVTLIAIDSNGCSDSVTKNLTIPYVHFAKAGNDTTTCLGVATRLQASGGVSYSWSPAATLGSPNSANTTASPQVNTTYIVTVTDALGCPDADTAEIKMVPGKQVVAGPQDTSVCLGKLVPLYASGVSVYRWSPPLRLTDTTISNPVATFNAPIQYVVRGMDSIGCISYDTLVIRERPAPPVVAFVNGNNFVDCRNKTIQLHVTGADNYTWEPAKMVSDPTSASPMTAPVKTTMYVVTGTDAFGCTATDTITVFADTHPMVFIPDAFTPNNDGHNDIIRPRILCDFVFERFEIFNRWGQSVFVSFRKDAGWDGMFNGSLGDMGTYMWLVKGHTEAGEPVFYKGDLTLIR